MLVALAAAGCDRSGFVHSDPGGASATGLRVVSSDVSDGVHAGHDAIRVQFDRALDPASVGARSVRVERPGGRRVRRLRVWSSGTSLFVAPPPDRALPADVELTLRLEGGGSPRALRAADGSALPTSETRRFRALLRRRTDLEGPRLVASVPEAGVVDAAPASHVQLLFDEPLARGSVREGEAVVVRVNGVEVPSRQRLSPDLTRLVVRPRRHVPPGAAVSVEVRPALLDLAGNPADPVTVRFRTKATHLRELSEDFVTTDMLDAAATTGGWGAPESPGYLVARAGRLCWSPVDGDSWDEVLPERERVRFQVLFPALDHGGGMASALRVHLDGAIEGDVLPGVTAQVGEAALVRVDPTFEANRRASALASVSGGAERLVVEGSEDDGPYVDVPFDTPALLRPGVAVLLEAELVLPPGVRIAASADPGELALVEDLGRGDLVPAVELLVSGGPPQARSLWWDSGIVRPGWQEARVVPGPLDDVLVEYQTAAATPDGRPDPDRTSEWSPDLAQLPSLRFVRFRVTFTRLVANGRTPRIDRVVLPYQE